MKKLTAEQICELLKLEQHPIEGGHFAQTYQSSLRLAEDSLPAGYSGARLVGTAIYYLLTPNTFSELHRLPGDEIFHFYLGDPVEMLELRPDGTGTWIVLGQDIGAGMWPQHVVPGGMWQGSRLIPGGEYALLGTTMAPGFDYADYETGSRERLIAQYPELREQIITLTRW
jgi:predicted cupin superfamily sugar epimerase